MHSSVGGESRGETTTRLQSAILEGPSHTVVISTIMCRIAYFTAALALVFAQQPEQAHLSLTGTPGELSLDFMHHDAKVACNSSVGVEIGTSPDFTASSFVPAYACSDFTAQESTT